MSIDGGRWKVIAATAAGASHLRSGLPCQDQVDIRELAGGVLIAALADGAGSAALAKEGAEVCVRSFVSYVAAQSLDGVDIVELMNRGFRAARSAVFEEADRLGTSARDLASTLLAVVVVGDTGAALQIGDGVIVFGEASPGWSWVFWPQRGEYANTTHFVSDDDAEAQVAVEEIPTKVLDVALMSDGLEPLALQYADKIVHEPFFRGLFRPLTAIDDCGGCDALQSALTQFLASERVSARTDDDVSIVVATRRLAGPLG